MALYSLMGLIISYYVAVWLVTVFECTPVQKAWEKTIPGTCIDTATFFFVNAAFNIATDVAIMLLPIPVIKSLHLPIRQRVVLSFVFAVGMAATATSTVRIFTLNVNIQSVDPTWEIGQSSLWSAAEMNTAIICACLPVLKAPLQAVFPRLFSAASRARSNGTYYGNNYGSNYGGYGPRSPAHSQPTQKSRFSRNLSSLPMDTLEKRLHGDNSDRASETSDTSDDEMYILQGTDPSVYRAAQDGQGIMKSMDIQVTFEDQQQARSSSSRPNRRVGEAL